jgi:heme-degrading monooxygenase HmoA
MIVRVWQGEAVGQGIEAYRKHFQGNVVPELGNIPGFRGASLLERAQGDGVEFLVMTRWVSMDAVRAFAGAQPEKAVVEPEAVAALRRFDATVRHYEVGFEGGIH